MENLEVRIFSVTNLVTKNPEVLFVSKEPNRGTFEYVSIQVNQLPDGNIASIDYVNSSLLHFSSQIEPIIKAIYKGVKIPKASTCLCLSSHKVKLVEDFTDVILASSEFPASILSLEEKDSNGTSLKDYLLATFGYIDTTGNLVVDIPLEDISMINTKLDGALNEYPINAHDPASKLSPAEALVFMRTEDQELYDSIESTKACKQVDNYLHYLNPVQNHKLIMLYGNKGTGKSTLATHIAVKYKLPIVSITGDPSVSIEDLAQQIIPNNGNDGSTTPWITQESDFLRAYKEGWVIQIDEVNNFSNNVLIGLNDAFYGAHRAIKVQGKVIPCHPNTIIICTTNFGYQGNNPMNEAFVDRFYPVLMTDFVDEQYASYLAKKFPNLDASAIKEYTKFMFKLMKYMEETFESQDQFNVSTPSISVRRFSEVLVTAIASGSFKQVLGNVIYAIIHGVEDPKTSTAGVLSNFDKEIAKIEQAFFTDKSLLKKAKASLKKLLAVGSPVANGKASATNTNNAETIFERAANLDESSSEEIINGLNNISFD